MRTVLILRPSPEACLLPRVLNYEASKVSPLIGFGVDCVSMLQIRSVENSLCRECLRNSGQRDVWWNIFSGNFFFRNIHKCEYDCNSDFMIDVYSV